MLGIQINGPTYTDKAKIRYTRFICSMAFMTSNLFLMGNTAITPYLGGGVGISRNKMRDNDVEYENGIPDGTIYYKWRYH